MQKERNMFGFLRKSKPQPIQPTPHEIITPYEYPFIERATGEEKDRLERNCDELLSKHPDYFMTYDFTDYVDNMIKLLGVPKRGYLANQEYTSASILFRDDEIEGTIAFSKNHESRNHTIHIGYVNQFKDNPYFNGEDIKLDPIYSNLEWGRKIFTEISRFPHPDRHSTQYAKTLTENEPVELHLEPEQKGSQSVSETIYTLSKIYALYHEDRYRKENSNPQVQ